MISLENVGQEVRLRRIKRGNAYVEWFFAGDTSPSETLQVEYPPIEPGSIDQDVLRARRDSIAMQLRLPANVNRFRFFEKIIVETVTADGRVTTQEERILASAFYWPAGRWLRRHDLLEDKFGNSHEATAEDTVIDASIYSGG